MEHTATILIVDDEPQIRRALRVGLAAHGYEVLLAGNGEEALDQVALHRPDLIVLDLAMPVMDGFEVCRRVREWSQAPIIVLSVRRGETDKVKALDLGADDYLTKPFGMEELLARIRANLRRTQSEQQPEPVLTVGEVTIDFSRRLVTVRGEEVKLTKTEYEILRYLAQNMDKVITHRQLLREVWGPDYEEDIQCLRVHIGHLRQKIEPSPPRFRYILTEPGVGYRFRTS
jgi:two-component system KDP operon response regulator KdpE